MAQNYSLSETEALCAAGQRFRHHLWGADIVRGAGHTIVSLGSRDARLLDTLSRLSGSQLGDLNRQALVRRTARLHDVDVIVCAETRFARGLALLRGAGVIHTPLVGVVHPYEPRRWADR